MVSLALAGRWPQARHCQFLLIAAHCSQFSHLSASRMFLPRAARARQQPAAELLLFLRQPAGCRQPAAAGLAV